MHCINSVITFPIPFFLLRSSSSSEPKINIRTEIVLIYAEDIDIRRRLKSHYFNLKLIHKDNNFQYDSRYLSYKV